MKKIKKSKKVWIKIILIILAVLFIGGIWQKIMINRELAMFLPPGKLYNINSHNMHLYSAGEGDITVVFMAGSGTPCAFTDFYYLQGELQQYAKTVSYDHPGYGWSDKTSNSRNIDTVVEELHELLEKANEKAPYILVAHSLASLEAIRFAQQYPDKVKGIVLLDGGSPEFYANDSEVKATVLNRVSAGLRVTGINRALGKVGIILPLAGENLRHSSLPDDLKHINMYMYYNHIGDQSNLNLISNINENAQTVINNGYLTYIPLLILSSDNGQKWEKAQQELLHWSNNSKQETIQNSQHYIHWSNKEIVLDKILKMINEVLFDLN